MHFDGFQVFNYRNVIDSGWIRARSITAFVGQNESGKSNLFDALYRVNPFVDEDTYDIDEDWPVDKWGEKDPEALVCRAQFTLTDDELTDLLKAAHGTHDDENGDTPNEAPPIPDEPVRLIAEGYYSDESVFYLPEETPVSIDKDVVDEWARRYAPKFVYIHEYDMSGTQTELDQFAQRLKTPWNQLSNDDQTIKIILDLARIDLKEVLEKGQTTEGRTTRTLDLRSASKYLSKQFQDLWRQKTVDFQILLDGTTLNIFAEDQAADMPVRLSRRSTGFRWHVSFAWKFTHASKGQYSNCVLLLEEPGIHLHPSGQKDVLAVFEQLSQANTLLYTTHLASMIQLSNPERVRIVEIRDHHTSVIEGIVSQQRDPMAVIEQSLGLSGGMTGLLGHRQTLIVEGGDDALILHKLSGVLESEDRACLPDQIYLWPAEGASKTPMYGAFAVGQEWDAGVLLDSDQAGRTAYEKIRELDLQRLAESKGKAFRVLRIGQAARIKKTDSSIEDLFPDEFYLKCVNEAYGIAISTDDLPGDGSSMITARVESVLRSNYSLEGLDKRRVLHKMLDYFDTWSETKHLPKGTATRAENLFKSIRSVFGSDEAE